MKPKHLFALIVFGAAVCFVGTAFSGGEKGQPKKIKGRLPNGWGKLGLSNVQKQQIYKIQADYRVKKDELLKKLTALKVAERSEMVKVLTQEQRDRLLKILLGGVDPDVTTTPAPKINPKE